MKKYYKLLTLLFIVLFAWVIILTIQVSKEKVSTTNVEIVENKVNGFSSDLSEVFEKVQSSVVTIETNNAISSACIYSIDENIIYCLTSYHSIADSNSIKVLLVSGKELEAKLVGKDILSDIAIISFESDLLLKPVSLGDSSLLKSGEFVLSVGTPTSKEYANSAEVLMISSPLRSISNSIISDSKTYDTYYEYIQLSGEVKQGYSGAPLFNMAGEVVGTILMKDDTATFALPINEIKIIAEKIINDGSVNKINFNIRGEYLKDLETYKRNVLALPLEMNSGLYINKVKTNSINMSLGLRVGDALLSINGTEINTHDDLLNIEYSGSKEFNCLVYRSGEEIILSGSIND